MLSWNALTLQPDTGDKCRKGGTGQGRGWEWRREWVRESRVGTRMGVGEGVKVRVEEREEQSRDTDGSGSEVG